MSSARGVLYVIICGVSNAAESYTFISDAKADGWDVCAITTPMGSRFVDVNHMSDLTCRPVRSLYKNPDEEDIYPPADVIVVAPASFNTINKIANGITDTLAVGIICEAMGQRKRVIIAPWMNRALASHGAYKRSLSLLVEDGAQLVLTERTKPELGPEQQNGEFPWKILSDELKAIEV